MSSVSPMGEAAPAITLDVFQLHRILKPKHFDDLRLLDAVIESVRLGEQALRYYSSYVRPQSPPWVMGLPPMSDRQLRALRRGLEEILEEILEARDGRRGATHGPDSA